MTAEIITTNLCVILSVIKIVEGSLGSLKKSASPIICLLYSEVVMTIPVS